MDNLFLAITAQYNLANKSIIISEDNIPWGDDYNPIRDDVQSAFILVQKGDEYPWKTVDVTTEIKSVGGIDELEMLEGEVTEDSFYGVFLVMSTVGYTEIDYEYYSLGAPLFIDTLIKIDISKFWVKYACATNLERKKGLFDICTWLESNLAGLQALASRREKAKYMELLLLIQRKVELNKHYLK
jgi:hypothetical protein